MYIHLYPTEDLIEDMLCTQRISVDRKSFYKCILPLARRWASNIDHIRWGDRLSRWNHHPYFPVDVTVIWDTTCFRIRKPRDWTFGRYVVNGHYDFPCFLVQIGITFTGEIVFAGELLRSTSYDARTFCDEGHLHPQYDWEYNIGDCHYACVENFFTPCAKVGGRVLSCREKLWNKRVQLVRARVEHLNTVLKQHSMFGGEPYRGWARNLAVFVKISLHASAVEVRMRGNIDGPRHDGYGPHKHNQAQI